jgi:hypothetical protein
MQGAVASVADTRGLSEHTAANILQDRFPADSREHYNLQNRGDAGGGSRGYLKWGSLIC